MDGLGAKDISFFLGKLPYREQECFFFVVGDSIIPVAYIRKGKIEEAKRLWGKMLEAGREGGRTQDLGIKEGEL